MQVKILPKVKKTDNTVLNCTVDISISLIKGIIPSGTEIKQVRIIAGYCTSTHLKVSQNLTDKFGGDTEKWQKNGRKKAE